jgi:hypothetical protein
MVRPTALKRSNNVEPKTMPVAKFYTFPEMRVPFRRAVVKKNRCLTGHGATIGLQSQVGLEPLVPNQGPLKGQTILIASDIPGMPNVHQETQSRPLTADQSFRPADSTGAKTAGQKVSWPAPARPPENRATLGTLRFETVRNCFSWPMPRARTSPSRAGLFAPGSLWQRQSQISWKWISAALATV